MTSLTTFDKFPELPLELRNMVWKAKADDEDAEKGGIVEVMFRRSPLLKRKVLFHRSRPWRLIYTYDLQPRNPSLLLTTTKESRAEYIKTHRDTLQLNRGPIVHFNARLDTLYFDAESFFNFWHYIRRHRFPPSQVPTRNLSGFEAVRVLGSYRGGPLNVHSNELFDVRVPVERALTNLDRIRCLGERGIHPGGWVPGTLPFAQRALHRRVKRALIQILDNFENNRTFPGHAQTTLAQRDRIDDARDDVVVDVDEFLGPAIGVVGIPVTIG